MNENKKDIYYHWFQYQYMVVAKNAGKNQINETRMAFSAGAGTAMRLLNDILSNDGNDEIILSEFVKLMDDITHFKKTTLESIDNE